MSVSLPIDWQSCTTCAAKNKLKGVSTAATTWLLVLNPYVTEVSESPQDCG